MKTTSSNKHRFNLALTTLAAALTLSACGGGGAAGGANANYTSSATTSSPLNPNSSYKDKQNTSSTPVTPKNSFPVTSPVTSTPPSNSKEQPKTPPTKSNPVSSLLNPSTLYTKERQRQTDLALEREKLFQDYRKHNPHSLKIGNTLAQTNFTPYADYRKQLTLEQIRTKYESDIKKSTATDAAAATKLYTFLASAELNDHTTQAVGLNPIRMSKITASSWHSMRNPGTSYNTLLNEEAFTGQDVTLAMIDVGVNQLNKLNKDIQVLNASNIKDLETPKRGDTYLDVTLTPSYADNSGIALEAKHGTRVVLPILSSRSLGIWGIAPQVNFVAVDTEAKIGDFWSMRYKYHDQVIDGASIVFYDLVAKAKPAIVNYSGRQNLADTYYEQILQRVPKLKELFTLVPKKSTEQPSLSKLNSTLQGSTPSQDTASHSNNSVNTNNSKGNNSSNTNHVLTFQEPEKEVVSSKIQFPRHFFNQHLASISESDGKPVRPSLSYGFEQIVKQQGADALPLTVLASGNLENYLDIIHYYQALNNWKQADFQALKQEKEMLYFKHSADGLAALLVNGSKNLAVDPAVSKSLLFVGGVITDTKGEERKEYERIIDSFISSKPTTEVKFTQVYSSNYDYSEQSFTQGKVILSPSSYACGAIKEHCLVAPFIWGTIYHDNEYYQSVFSGGTSYSAPIVSAVASLVKEQFPWMTTSQLKQTLLTTATDLGKPGVDDIYGWGMVNAYGALGGPAGLYDPEPFVVDMTKVNKYDSYTFRNDILGTGDLIVKGKTNDSLYLLGSLYTTGKITVDSGNLILQGNSQPQDRYNPHLSATSTKCFSSDSIKVNYKGSLYLSHAKVNKVYNTGQLHVSGASSATDLLLSSQGHLYLYLSNNTSNKGFTTPFTVKGNAVIGGTLTLTLSNLSYLPSQSGILPVIQAEKLVGRFSQVNYKSNTPYLIFSDLTYDKSHNQVIIKYTRNNTSSVAQALASSRQSKDQHFLLQGSQQISKIFDLVTQELPNSEEDNTVLLTSSSPATSTTTVSNTTLSASSSPASLTNTASNTVLSANSTPTTPTSTIVEPTSSSVAQATASFVQGLNRQQLTQLFLSQTATLYSNAQLTSYTALNSDFRAFQESNTNFGTPQPDGITAYFSASTNSNSWQQAQSQLKGNFKQQATVAGFNYKRNTWSWGLAAYYGQGDWQEKFAATQSILGTVEHKTAGVFTTLTYTTDEWFSKVGLALAQHSFTANRYLVDNIQANSKFKKLTTLLDLQVGYLLVGKQSSGLALTGGITVSHNYQQAFKENGDYTLLNFQAQARNHFRTQAHLGLQTWYNFKLGKVQNNIDLSLNLQQALGKNHFNLHLQDGSQTAVGFSHNFLADLTLGYSVQLTSNLSLRLAGSYQKAKEWHAYQGQAQLKVNF